MTDFWAPYWNFEVLHVVCGAHPGRELVATAEVPRQIFGNGRFGAALAQVEFVRRLDSHAAAPNAVMREYLTACATDVLH